MKAMKDLGINVIRSQVGDRYVIQDMLKNNANLGGEQSGHMIFLDHNTTGDGLVSALQVLRIMIETDSKLSDLAAFVKKYPQTCINVRVKSKTPLNDLKKVQEAIKNVEQSLGDSGRVLVRYSGTENICRVMVEGPKQQQVQQMAQSISHIVSEEIGA
jgi:phosphoglucosamine mutase